jgi:NAD(P)-dependent dehydrogenase (short-subunit alcohol dehydrogenase family)
VHRPVRPPYPAQHAGAFGARQVQVTPLLQRAKHHAEFLAGRRELVGKHRPGAGLLVRLALHHAEFDQGREAVGQHIGSDGEPVSELGEPVSAQECLPQDQEGPALAEDAKSAEWSLTNALRQELAPQGTRVSTLHVGHMDTDMARHVDAPKSDPAVIAKLAIDGIEAGDAEIIADEISQRVRAGLSGGVAALYPQVA